jgi:hypothetical protein
MTVDGVSWVRHWLDATGIEDYSWRTDMAVPGDAGQDRKHGLGFVGKIMVDTITAEATVSRAEEQVSRGGSAPTARYSRRLSDKILIAFHHACDQSDIEVAEQLLRILEMMLTRRPLTPDGTRRRNMESLVAAHERLWHLRHPDNEGL